MLRFRRSALLVLAIAAALVCGWLTWDVIDGGRLSTHDLGAIAWFSARRDAILDTVMIWISLSGGPSATAVYATIIVIACLARRRIATALAVTVLIAGVDLSNDAIKHLVHRSRPLVHAPLTSLTTFSFPSGHAAAATAFGALVCLLASRPTVRRTPAAIIVACALSWIVLVCLSRIYLGLHYPTDVIAGVAEATFWLAIWLAAVDTCGIRFGFGRTGIAS